MILQLLASGDDNSSAAKSNTEKEKRICSPKQISVEETHNREHKCHHQMQVWNNSYYCHDAAAPLGCLCRLWRSKGSTQHQSTQQSLLNSYKRLKIIWELLNVYTLTRWVAREMPVAQPGGIPPAVLAEGRVPPIELRSSIFQYSGFSLEVSQPRTDPAQPCLAWKFGERAACGCMAGALRTN